MTTLKPGELCICIASSDPREELNMLIKALAAAVRWRAHYSDQYKGDDDNLVVLAQLQETLSENNA